MVLIQDKLKHNLLIFIVTIVGLAAVEGILLVLWFTVLAPGLGIVEVAPITEIIDEVVTIKAIELTQMFDIHSIWPAVAFTVFFAYIAGTTIRGMEKKSHGLDLYNMDVAEIEIEIGLLQKEKRKREELLVEQKRAKEDARAFKKANNK